MMLKALSKLFLTALILPSVNFAGEFVALSDIHFNPFESCKVGPPCALIQSLRESPASDWESILKKEDHSPLKTSHAETNNALLLSTLAFIKSLQTTHEIQPDFVLLGGDYLGHSFKEKYILYSGDTSQAGYESFVKKTLSFLTQTIQKAFPQSLPMLLAVGNNDSYDGDYIDRPEGPFFKDFDALLTQKSHAKIEFPHKTQNGYYKAWIPNPKNPSKPIEILVLNSVWFSEKAELPAKGSEQTLKAIEQNQLTWLKTELASAQHQQTPVWILMHIPDVIDDYASKHAGHSIPLWQPEANQTFIGLLNQYPTTISAIFTGHFHTNGEHTYWLGQKNPLALKDDYFPGIDSTHGNPPEFKVYEFNNQTLKIEKIRLYTFLTSTHWVLGGSSNP